MRFFGSMMFLLIGALYSAALAAAPDVRVRVQKRASSVHLRGVSIEVRGAENVRWATVGLSELDISWKSGRFKIQERNSPLTASLAGEWISLRGAFLQLGGKRVTGEVLLNHRRGGIDVIVVLPMEHYLAGVIPAEMPLSWPTEALKAQTVAARSFALTMAAHRKEKKFDVDSTVYDQVHKFAEDMDLKPAKRRKLKKIIEQTRGEVLYDDSEKVLRAFYSADCGCKTEDPKYVWGASVASLQSVTDPTCGTRSPRVWNLKLTRQDIRDRLIRGLGLAKDALLRALHIGARSPSGRVKDVVASFAIGGDVMSYTFSSQEFRRIVGFDRVRSTDFKLTWLGEELMIRGQGVGHGVGLCQTGARALAKSGANYQDILKVYYPRAKVGTL